VLYVARHPFDKPGNRHIVSEQPNKKTPPEGADNTNRGLTSQADVDSMAADRNSSSALPSRQVSQPAPDDFSFQEVEYCAPPEDVVDRFVRDVWADFSQTVSGETDSLAIQQGLKQFMSVVIDIQTKQANEECQFDSDKQVRA
jgi:hypothetical protein